MESVLKRNFDCVGARMSECISNSFPTNAVNFIANYWVQGTRRSLHSNAEIDCPLGKKFLWHLRKNLIQILGSFFRHPEPANCFSTIVDHTPHQFENPTDEWRRC